MHRLVAERYRRDPAFVIRFALENLERWREGGVDCDDFLVWEEILGDRRRDLPQVLTGNSEEAIRLRQSSLFAGLIPEEDRRRILASSG